ncbi:rhodanese-like domain-containing protein [Lacunimicrobium album]
MLLKYFYDKSLAHASYMVGCQRTGEAIVIDPGRDITPYLEMAAAEGLKIVGAAETHIHADFVSGARELGDRTAARLYLSDEGPAEWKYEYASQGNVQLVKQGDVIRVGNVKLDVLHTPGHTPEHISFLLTDEGGGANAPMGIFTGDFVFVGSIGRPDLLETAAGVVGSAQTGARQLFQSMRKFRDLPDYLQIWPAHGAGSACGKGLGAVPSSTVGYEKMFNPAMRFEDEQAFVDYILDDQPETPFYFAEMKRVNKVGPELARELPTVNAVASNKIGSIVESSMVIDLTPSSEFAQRHVPGTVNIPLKMLVQWAGFLVDYRQPVYLLAHQEMLPEVLKSLRSIGIDQVGGYFDAGEIASSGLRTESYETGTPEELSERIHSGQVHLIDVRSTAEYRAGHIPQAEHRFLGTLLRNLNTLDRSRPIVAQCQSGARSSIASSLLQREGFHVTNLQGGFKAWQSAQLPTVTSA